METVPSNQEIGLYLAATAVFVTLIIILANRFAGKVVGKQKTPIKS